MLREKYVRDIRGIAVPEDRPQEWPAILQDIRSIPIVIISSFVPYNNRGEIKLEDNKKKIERERNLLNEILNKSNNLITEEALIQSKKLDKLIVESSMKIC